MARIWRTCREGRIKAKVRSLMLAEGWEVTLWWEQQGDYRIHKYHWDLACWGCHATALRDFPRAAQGMMVDMACWATMSECAKGLTVSHDPREGWQVEPK